MKDRFILANVFSAKQNEKYLEEMNNYIEFLRETTKELAKTNNSFATLKLNMDQIRRHGTDFKGLRRHLMMKVVIIKFCGYCSCLSKQNELNQTEDVRKAKPDFINPQRIEKMNAFESLSLQQKIKILIINSYQQNARMESLILTLQNEEVSTPWQSLSSHLSKVEAAAQMVTSEFPSFKGMHYVVNYYPALKHLKIPMSMPSLYVMLNMGLLYDADIAVITSNFNNEEMELSVAMNGVPWSMETIENMEKSLHAEHHQKVNVNATKKFKWFFRPISLLIRAHQENGSFGVRQVGNGRNATVINKAIYYKFPMSRNNPGFDFQKWRQRNENKKYVTRVWQFGQGF